MRVIPTMISAALILSPDHKRLSRLAVAARKGSLVPVLTIVLAIVAIWYVACLPMNRDLPQLAGVEGVAARYEAAWNLEQPVLPAPHQIVEDLYATTIGTGLVRDTENGLVLNPRNLLSHAWITLSAALLGFMLGVLLGVGLAASIVFVKALRMSLMPWIIASQTVPILAVAPIVIVALGSVGIVGLLPKALISAYLSFLPVTIGMVKGLTSPEPVLLGLMRTYHASPTETFFKLRLPASIPLLFASLKVSISISLIGAIVGELPTGAQSGLGARLLAGSYYGQTVQIWSALVMAATLAALLIMLMTVAERKALRAMGGRP